VVGVQEKLLGHPRAGGSVFLHSLPRPLLLSAQFKRALRDVGGMETVKIYGEGGREGGREGGGRILGKMEGS